MALSLARPLSSSEQTGLDYPNAMADSRFSWAWGAPSRHAGMFRSLGMSSGEAVFGALCLEYSAKALGRPTAEARQSHRPHFAPYKYYIIVIF